MRHVKILFMVILLSSIYFAQTKTAFCTNIHMVSTKINEEIETDKKQKILEIKNNLFVGLKNRDCDEIRKLLSPILLESKDFKIESFVNQLSKLINQTEFVVIDQYYSTLKKLGKESKATIVPSLTDKNKFMINNLIFYGGESYNLFLRSATEGWQYLFFISFGKFDEKWKINIMHVGTYSIRGLTVPKLYEIGKKAKDNDRLTSSVVYSWAIGKAIRPAPYLQYIDEQKYVDFMKSSFADFNEKIKFPFKISGKEFVGFKIETTDSEGLIPVFLYLTSNDLSNPVVEEEAAQLKGKILNKFVGLEQDFDYVLLRAYNELPSDPNKTYQTRGTVLKLTKKKI